MIWVKQHNGVLAACDEELLGKTFQQGEVFLEVKEDFYKGELVGEKEFVDALRKNDNINLVGEKVVSLAKKEKMVAEVKKVEEVPYALIFRF